MSGFRVTEIELDSTVAEIKVEGEVDLAVVEALQRAIERAPSGTLLVDLGACEFIDSAAIAALVMAHRNGHRILTHGASGQVLRVLEVTGLAEHGLVFESRSEALSRL
jgi:anti-anti-sigma factor